MKRFFTLSFLLISFAVLSQNLIPDPSAEDVVECPSSLGNIDVYTSTWRQFRGTPDYWNSCSDNPLLGWNNSVGYQEPRTGEGYLGLFSFHQGLANARESFGIELDNPLQIGETYYLSFHVSTAYKPIAFNMASNNIGALFMVDNYIDPDELGFLPNYSNFATEEIVTDTANWVNISYSFVCDSAYRYLCFGNFYDDSLTDTLRLEGDLSNALSYYYFDDFCLSLDSTLCDFITSVELVNHQNKVIIYPNPARGRLNIKTNFKIKSLEIYSITGVQQTNYHSLNKSMESIDLKLESGIYILNIFTEREVIKKRFVVQ